MVIARSAAATHNSDSVSHGHGPSHHRNVHAAASTPIAAKTHRAPAPLGPAGDNIVNTVIAHKTTPPNPTMNRTSGNAADPIRAPTNP
ncbi:hypothetical protein GCM10027167_44930 [Nocardia heshunensis]